MKRLLAVVLLSSAVASGAEGPQIRWESYSNALFARAKQEHRLVILDLGAVWCHWCHVMEDTTYRDPKVVALIGAKYIAIKADQDADPDLSRRYEDYGWPATIVFAPDGSELVKRRGYLPPERMASMLQELVDDPTPGPSVQPEIPWQKSNALVPGAAQKKALEQFFAGAYDQKWGGWGTVHKFVDAEPLEYALAEPRYRPMAKKTLDAALALIDPVWGGMYQYSDKLDWSSPHYEKIMSVQTDAIRMYVAAYRRWKSPAHLEAAQAIARYLAAFMTSPDGAFYTSQDADLDEKTTGHVYYASDDAGRRKLGMPRIDKHIYPRENGWAIGALVELYAVTHDAALLERARRAAELIETNRRLPDGGYRHGEVDRAGPYLGDSLAMADAYLRLNAVDPKGPWLSRARAAAAFIDAHFRHPDAGFVTAPAAADSTGVFTRPARIVEENLAVARLAIRLRDNQLRDAAMRFLTSPTLTEVRPFSPGVLTLP